MKFTYEQVVFVAKCVLDAAFDRIEAGLPDTITLEEYQANNYAIDSMIGAAQSTAAMALAIFFAQTTNEGMGVWDWAGSKEFRKACVTFVTTRTNPIWKGLQPGEPCTPDTEPFAKMFADEWFVAVSDV